MRILRAALTVFLLLAGGFQEANAAGNTPPARGPESAVLVPIQSLLDGKPAQLWEMLPQSYRVEFTNELHASIAALSPETWDQVFVVLGRTGTLLEEKAELFVEWNQDAYDGESARQAATESIVMTGRGLQALAGSELAVHETAVHTDPGAFLETTGSSLFALFGKAAELQPEGGLPFTFTSEEGPFTVSEVLDSRDVLKAIRVEVARRDGDAATLVIHGLPGSTVEKRRRSRSRVRPGYKLEVVEIEGRWLPKVLVEERQGGVTSILSETGWNAEAVAPAVDTQTMKNLLTLVETGLSQASPAQNSEQLQMVLMQTFFGAVFSLQQPQMAPPAAIPNELEELQAAAPEADAQSQFRLAEFISQGRAGAGDQVETVKW